jgi:membrane associated rhomboid family serine protease
MDDERPPILITREDAARVRTWRRSQRRFAAQHEARTPVTRGLLAVFVAFHALTGLSDVTRGGLWGVVFGGRSTEVLTRYGGRARELVAEGDWWRLLSAGLLHGDMAHLAFNAFAWLGLGRLGEAVFGSARMLLVFLLSVLGGNVLSQMGEADLSIGASGGIFGLMGALGAFGWRRGARMPEPLRAVFSRDLWPMVALNLVIGFALPMVDNRGHIGGLITGGLLGLLLDDRVTMDSSPGGGRVAAGVGGALLAVALFGVLRGV